MEDDKNSAVIQEYEGDKLKITQLSFLAPIEKTIKKHEVYGATICSRCCCDKCKYGVEIYPFINTEECKEIKENSCFNCDECYYYGMDNESLSRDVIKFQCAKFEMSDHYAALEVKRRRKSFKII